MSHHQSLVSDFLPLTWVDGPGNRLVLFFQGCNFDCQACHNPQTIPLESVQAKHWSVDDTLERVRASMPFIRGITASGGEATLQWEFLVELFGRIKRDPEFAHLTTFIDSNGQATQEVWEALLPVTDGVMLDLKVLDDALHRQLTTEGNASVLASIRYLAAAGRLYEVRLMLVPGLNDADEQLRATANWLLAIDPLMRVKINHFHAHGTRSPASTWLEADEERRERNRAVLLDAGVQYLC
jgi:pyruvate formate lyase activating enzyme